MEVNSIHKMEITHTQVRYEEVTQMPMVSIPATLLSLSQPTFMTSCDISYHQLNEEEKTWASFTNDSAQYAGTTQKWMAAALQPLSRTSLKDSGKGNPPSGQNFEQCMWLFILLSRNGQRCHCIPVHRM